MRTKHLTDPQKAALVLLSALVFIVLLLLFSHLHAKSPAQTQLEYETLKSYLDLPEQTLSSLLYGSRLKGSLAFVEAFEFGENVLFVMRNTGEIPLTGFGLVVNGTDIETSITPALLLPNSTRLIIVKTAEVGGTAPIAIRTRQGVGLELFRPE